MDHPGITEQRCIFEGVSRTLGREKENKVKPKLIKLSEQKGSTHKLTAAFV